MPHPELNLPALRKIAEGATQGEWRQTETLVYTERSALVLEVTDSNDLSVDENTATALHIATFSPATVLRLLDRLDKSHSLIGRLLDIVHKFDARADHAIARAEAAEASLAQAVEMARREEREAILADLGKLLSYGPVTRWVVDKIKALIRARAAQERIA